jgi:hypothetical protein
MEALPRHTAATGDGTIRLWWQLRGMQWRTVTALMAPRGTRLAALSCRRRCTKLADGQQCQEQRR